MREPMRLAPGETRVYTVEISISYEFMKEGVEE